MLRFANLTLHDLFGFLTPGIVVLSSLTSVHVFLGKSDQVKMVADFSTWEALTFLFISYLLGHLVAAIARKCARFTEVERKEINALPDEIIAQACEKCSDLGFVNQSTKNDMSRKVHHPGGLRGNNWWGYFWQCYKPVKNNPNFPNRTTLIAFCNRALTQRGQTDRRDIFMYREELFRGLTIALAVMAVCMLIIIIFVIIPNYQESSFPVICYWGGEFNLGLLESSTALLLALIGAFFSFCQFMGFVCRRVMEEVYGFLTMKA